LSLPIYRLPLVDHEIFNDGDREWTPRTRPVTVLRSQRPCIKSRPMCWISRARFDRSTTRAKSRSLACCASQCDASSIKQAAIHGATVSRLQVIVGPALGFVHRRKTEREREGRSEETERNGKERQDDDRERERERRRDGEDEQGERELRGVLSASARVCGRATRDCVHGEISLGSLAPYERNRMKRSRQRSSTRSSVKSASL